ncbi:c2h2-type zinc finger transcription factor [Gigaspora margarita]|uniref:C2h2-type zinc finger transcription factor n=1 Tax=Gigaspora margarita TaxID=4874 RepID=A0A8H4AXM7_GIGMA|nr:c2h2-type zinc finger transcription factor [Gigaspora margarita]
MDSDIKNLYSLSDEDDLNLEQLFSEFELMVEDVYYKMKNQSKWHPDDKPFETIFTNEELEEIQSYNSKELPELSDNLLEFLLKFDKDTLEELKNVLLEQKACEGNNYNKVTHFDLKWIKKSICDLVNEYENDNIKYGCHENWYIIHFWSLIDHSLSDLDLYGDRVGRYYNGINDTKILKERGLKCPKLMKDMFVELGNVVKWDEMKIQQFEIIGWIHAELAVMLMRLDSPNGYTCHITRSPLYHLAEDVKNFEKNLESWF